MYRRNEFVYIYGEGYYHQLGYVVEADRTHVLVQLQYSPGVSMYRDGEPVQVIIATHQVARLTWEQRQQLGGFVA